MKIKAKVFSVDFAELEVTFRVSREFMESHSWKYGEMEIDLSEVCEPIKEGK